MRSPSYPKIWIFDLEGLWTLYQKIYSTKFEGTIKIWNFSKRNFSILQISENRFLALLSAFGIFYSLHKITEERKWKNFALKIFRFWLFLQILFQNLFDSTYLSLSRSKIRFFRQNNNRSGLRIWLSLPALRLDIIPDQSLRFKLG